MRIRVILVIIVAIAFASVIAQIGENNLIITITSDGKAKVSQTLFPKTYVSTIDVDLISSQISNMLVTDEKDVFLGTTQSEDSVKIATLGAAAVDLKYNADVISYESGVFRLKFNSEQESRVILPPLSKIVSINTIPIEVNERDYLLPPGNISISYTIRPVTSQEFIIPVGDKEQKIEAITAAKIEEFAANNKEIQFIIKDKATILVIIPTLVLANPDDITLNNEQVDFREFHQNSTHSWIRIEPHEKGLVKISDSSPVSDDGGGCLIATAAFGSEMAPQVQLLREIRDNKVMSTGVGASFMTGFNQFYYSFSPYVADFERENPAFKELVKTTITPMIFSLSIMTLAEGDSESDVLGLGISVIALNLGMYIVAPAILGYEIKKMVRTKYAKPSNWSIKFNINVVKTLKTGLFGIMAVLVLLVSVPSAFAQSDESESPIRMILDLTRNNLLESLDSASEIPSSAQTFYDMGQVEYEKAIAALEEGDTEAAKEHALIAMALYEDSASIIGALEESRVLDQLPEGFGKAVDSASDQGVENGQGLGVGGIPPGIMKQMLASNIFEMQEEITDVDIEVENLRDLISSNNLNIDLSEYDKTINLAKEVLANGDIPNAQAKLALANEIKSDLYDQINLAVAENQDERINEFVEKSIKEIEELLSKGENLGLTKKAISELEDTLEALKSGNIDESLEKTGDKSKFADEIKEIKEAEKDLKEENNAEEELKEENNAEEELKEENNADNENNETPDELPNGFGAAGDNPSENGFENGNGLGLGNIPPGLVNSYEISFDSNPDDYFENHFEGTFEDVFEASFDGTNKGYGNGKGNFGDLPGKSDAPGQIKVKKSSNNNNKGIITDGESGNILGTVGVDYTVQGFTAIKNGNDITDSIRIKVEGPSSPPAFANNVNQGYVFQPDEPGVWTITASAQGLTGVRTVTVAAAGGGNNPPTANAGPDQTVSENTLVTLTGLASFDTDGTIVTYSWARTNNGGQDPVLSDSTAASPTFTAPDVPPSGRTYEYTLTVTDNLGATGTDIVVITVNDGVGGGGGNTPPEAGPNISFSVSDETTGVILDGSGATDIEDDSVPIALTYSWVKTSGAGPANDPLLSSYSVESPTFTAPTIGGSGPDRIYVFTLTVRDSGGLEDTKTITVTVTND